MILFSRTDSRLFTASSRLGVKGRCRRPELECWFLVSSRNYIQHFLFLPPSPLCPSLSLCQECSTVLTQA